MRDATSRISSWSCVTTITVPSPGAGCPQGYDLAPDVLARALGRYGRPARDVAAPVLPATGKRGGPGVTPRVRPAKGPAPARQAVFRRKLLGLSSVRRAPPDASIAAYGRTCP
jgi:hypothetical protein